MQVVERRAVDVQGLAEILSRQPAVNEDSLGDRLAENIEDLVHKIVNSHMTSYRALAVSGEHDELVNECLERVFDKINSYSSDQSRFSTWVTTVCSNFLKSKCRYALRKCRTCLAEKVEIDDSLPLMEVNLSDATELAFDIQSVLVTLSKAKPDGKPLLKAMFGNYEESGWRAGEFVDPREVASSAGFNKAEAERFYEGIIRPFFKKMLG